MTTTHYKSSVEPVCTDSRDIDTALAEVGGLTGAWILSVAGATSTGTVLLRMRFTVQHAGVLSARDARASFYQQRAGKGAAEVTGSHSL